VSGVKGGVSGKSLYGGVRERGGGVILNNALYVLVFCPQLQEGVLYSMAHSPAGLPDAFREHEVPNLIESVW
jgi:hypothetical protein